MTLSLICSRILVIVILTTYSLQAFGDIIENIEDLEPKPKKEKKEKKDSISDERPKELDQATPDELPKDLKKLEQEAEKTKPKKKPAKKERASQKKKTSSNSSKEPVLFKGDGPTTYARQDGIITLQENVMITQGDLRMQSDRAKVTLSDDDSSKENVRKVEISGRVKMTKLDPDPKERVVAHGDRAIFLNSEQKVRLIGNARLYRGGDLMKGNQIVYELDTGLVIVDKAQGVVQPSEDPQEARNP